MASLSLFAQFETNLLSNRKVIELLLQLKSAMAHGKNYIKVKPHMVRHLLRNRLSLQAAKVAKRACNTLQSFSGGGGALECNLIRRCSFFKDVHNPFRKKMHFDTLSQNC